MIDLNAFIPTGQGDKKMIGHCLGAGLAQSLAQILATQSRFSLVIVPDFPTATRLQSELEFFLPPDDANEVIQFPDWETLPYDTFSPHQDIISDRLKALYRLPQLKRGILIVPISTLMHRLCPVSFVTQQSLWLKQGQCIDVKQLREQLIDSGYRVTSQVYEHGEFAIRGSIIDLFPMGSNQPFRIDLFDDEIDSIRSFDPETQRSIHKMDNICLLPAREFPFDEQAIAGFRTRWRSVFHVTPQQCPVYQDVSQGLMSPGIEYYLPLFFEHTATLLDYLPKNTLVVRCLDCPKAMDDFWHTAQYRYEQYGHDITRPLLPVLSLFVAPDEINGLIGDYPQLHLKTEPMTEKAGRTNLPCTLPPDLSYNPKLEQPYAALMDWMAQFPGRVLFCAETPGRREILLEQLTKAKLDVGLVSDWAAFSQSEHRYALTVSPVEHGVIWDDIALVSEQDLVGQKVMQQRRRSAKVIDPDIQIRQLAELKVGDPVVHIEHGVGRYQGLVHIQDEGQTNEFMLLEYAGNDKLYVPVGALHLISRYSALDLEHAPLHYLGTDKWRKEKEKAKKQVRDVACELLDIYAKRQARQGIQSSIPEKDYEIFASAFPFEETVDQAQAIDAVLKDLASKQPMDRVVCGDVGFGKTEVAMRAAFVAVNNHKQVAVLVPTTLLAQQHFQTFSDRFADVPVKIELLSRFRSKKEIDKALEGLAAGQVDIIIGTHRLLQNDVQFDNVGLVVIDEEHRFGVRHKEKLKSLRSEVDILTLTATPIPRTLNMSMSGLRDLSIIATPPEKRLSVKTFVRPRNRALIQESILRELKRGGQVYFLHNQVDTIEKTAHDIREWVPDARVAVAHGQMPERQLEQIMSDFYHRQANVLVCTTIIETGIDIPTANTIIIDRADKLGLAQLHQLRGRVGRSHHQAYAFCLCPAEGKMTSDAKKRLEALEALETLGSGFALATHDLEIRGAGELLGQEQSGEMQTIGYQLYMELLDHAVKMLKKGDKLDDIDWHEQAIEIDLQWSAVIPEDYLPDVHTRLMLYKKIASANEPNRLDEIKVEMIDRFGLLPQEVEQLLSQTRLKLRAEALGIAAIKANAHGGTLTFKAKPKVEPAKIVALMSAQPQVYSMSGPSKLRFKTNLSDALKRHAFVESLLNNIS